MKTEVGLVAQEESNSLYFHATNEWKMWFTVEWLIATAQLNAIAKGCSLLKELNTILLEREIPTE